MESSKNSALFFKYMNAITERFFAGKEVDIDQLKIVALNGKIEKQLLVSVSQKIYEIVTQTVIYNQPIMVLKILVDIRSSKLLPILESEFLPIKKVYESHSEKNRPYLDFIDDKVAVQYGERFIGNEKIRKGKVMIFKYCEFDKPKEKFFMFYKKPIHYSSQPKPKNLFVEYSGGPRHKSYIPHAFVENSLILVMKK